ncbi:MAG: class IV adenylate cyclase [Candidatus Odinarchaeota archaeon]
MIEVEVKVELRDRGEFQLRLLNLGALKLSVERQNDIYFKHPVIDFRATDEALRLRRAGGEVYLTYKGPKMMSGSKTREELNLKFNDFDTARRIFEKLKFQPLAEIVKTRITYQLDDIKIYMDDVEELGCYAEFEILVKDNMEVETAERRIFSLIERLGFKPSHSITNSYLELMLKKRSD